jgi:transcriptional regulator with XRE-family HTH domain
MIRQSAINDRSAVARECARKLLELRGQTGQTQKQLAARLGMTESMISRLESGDHVPRLKTLCRIAEVFGRQLEIVFHEHEHVTPGARGIRIRTATRIRITGMGITGPGRPAERAGPAGRISMHAESLDSWRHEHVFLGEHHARNERRSWAVVALCGAMMAAEIVGGWLWGSMALIADGLHMSTHAGALVIAAFAYAYARRHARDERFTFGTGKLGDLAAFASAIVLAAIALLIGYESVERLVDPVPIAFDQAIPLAVLGLVVNLLSAWLLHDGHGHAGEDTHEHAHGGEHGHHRHDADHNLRAAYVHVMADAAVSVLALIGLGAGRVPAGSGWTRHGNRRHAGDRQLVVELARFARYYSTCGPRTARRRDRLTPGDRRARPGRRPICGGSGRGTTPRCVIGVGPSRAALAYKARLAGIHGLSHVTVEVHACPGEH